MQYDVLLAFFISTFFISATPGPNMLLAFQHGINYGVKRTLFTLAGLSFGLFLLLCAALLGIDILSRQFPWILDIVKLLGASYLAYLGLHAWINAEKTANFNPPSTGLNNSESESKDTHKTNSQLFRLGIFVSLSNPKAILFFAALFPKFIDFSQPLPLQYLLLTIGFFISETTWQILYTVGGKKLSNWLQTGQRLVWLNKTCGLLFIFIACALLWDLVIRLL